MGNGNTASSRRVAALLVATMAASAGVVGLGTQSAYAARPAPAISAPAKQLPTSLIDRPRGVIPWVKPGQNPVRGATTAGAGTFNPRCSTCNPPLVFRAGSPVMGGLSGTPGHVTITPVYWAPPGYQYTSSYKSIINGYVQNVALASRQSTNAFSVSTQYWQQYPTGAPAQHIQYVVQAGAEVDDTSAFPPQGGPAGCTADAGFTACVTNGALQTELQARLAALALPMDDVHLYVVLFPQQVVTCLTPGSASVGTACSTNVFCAYHDANFAGTGYLIYTNQPFPALSHCADPSNGPQAPNGDSFADAQLNMVSHEANEAITDWAGAWSDAAGNENGDLCVATYGTPLGSTGVPTDGSATGTFYNQVIGSGRYYTQGEFSNEDFALGIGDRTTTGGAIVAGCVRVEELPTAIFAGPGSAAPGATVSFDGSASADADNLAAPLTYSWTWGDGTPNGTGATPSHVFASVGIDTVTLTVTDVDGWVGSVGHMVTVTGIAVTGVSPGQGPAAGGTSVLITGGDFTGATAVKFGAVAATTYAVTSATQIAATSPPGAGVVDVIVIAPIGTSGASSADLFTYVPPAGAPTNVVALGGEASASVYWSPPSATGGSPITGYTVTPSPSGAPVMVGGNTTFAVIAGLTDGTSYTFTVTATDAGGPGPVSAPSNAVTPGRGPYQSLSPQRILDTRDGTGGVPAAPLGAGSTLNAQITGHGGVPATGVSAVVLNVTATNTTAASFLTIYPAGVPRPVASNLNWVRGKTVPNLVEVALGLNGQVTVYNGFGSADVIFDVAGYVVTPTSTPPAAGLYNPVLPNRVLDTRFGTGAPPAPIGQGQTISVLITGAGGVPTSGVAAVVLNVTVTNPTLASYATAYPTGTVRPLASNLNFIAGQTVPNRVIAKVGSGGFVSFYNAFGSVDVVADVSGWFSDGAPPAGGSLFVGVTPTRILDTRATSNIGPGATLTLPVAGQGGVPAMNAALPPAAVVLNVTVTNPTTASFLTVWPDGAARPLASDLNYGAGQTVPNLVVVKLGATGSIDLFNAFGTADVVVDVVGWYG